MKKRALALAVAMVAGTSVVAAAQRPTPPMHMQNQPAMACPMGMQGMMNDSAMVAQMKSQLGLTDAQAQQIRAIHQRAMADVRNALTPAQRQKMDQMHQQMMMQRGVHPR